MRIIIRIKTLALITAILICTNNLFSQVLVERSKDKVIISGVAYFIHQVKKGETAYSISRAYGIAVEDLTRENPPALYGVKEGQTLRIPVKIVKDSRPLEVTPVKRQHDEVNFIYHSLKPGETVYSLSKSFGVSENEIIESNP
jgi:LysM repeat protein